MTKEQILEISQLPSGTIGRVLGYSSYEEIDKFVKWMFKVIIKKDEKNDEIWQGEIVSQGESVLYGLSNAVFCYKKGK